MTQTSEHPNLTPDQLKQAVDAVAKEYLVFRRSWFVGVVTGLSVVIVGGLATTVKLVLDEANDTARHVANEVVEGTAADETTRRIQTLEVDAHSFATAIATDRISTADELESARQARSEVDQILDELKNAEYGVIADVVKQVAEDGRLSSAIGDFVPIETQADEAAAKAFANPFMAPSDGLVLIRNGGNFFGESKGGVSVSTSMGEIRVRYDSLPSSDGTIGDSHVLPVANGATVRAWSSGRNKTVSVYFVPLVIEWTD